MAGHPQATPAPASPQADHGGAVGPVSLPALALAFFRLGATTFGGMWAATERIESELVRRERWLTPEDLKFLLLAATLIPAPKFLGLGALVGFKLRGWPGCILATLCLGTPSVLLVLTGVLFIHPSLLDGPLRPLSRAVSIAVVGLLFGSAYQMLELKLPPAQRNIGLALGAGVFVAILAGVPILIAALVGLGLGAVLIRGKS